MLESDIELLIMEKKKYTIMFSSKNMKSSTRNQNGKIKILWKYYLRVLEVPTTIRSSTANPLSEKEKTIEKRNETD